jgi:DNA-binding transcriptional regulator YiaG
MNMDLLNLYYNAKSKFGINELSKMLSVNKNTLSRWELLQSVPKSYQFDLMEILNMEINWVKK